MTIRALPLLLLSLTAAGCLSQGPCPVPADSPQGQADTGGDVYVSVGDPYLPGPFAVRSVEVGRCERGCPVPLSIYVPDQPGSYAVVVFQHGFLARGTAYSTILRHLAGHGFVVVAPQMYEPGPAALFGQPTAAEEAEWAARVLTWLDAHLADVAGVDARISRLGLAGHSRGGKVAWLMLTADAARARAVAGIDPVDGRGGPLGGQARVVQGTFAFSLPTLVLGTGLGGSCAPAGDNHEQFYAASPGPAWHIIATEHGHGDMLDAGVSDLAARVCAGGPDPDGMRRLVGGLLTAFFRGSLQGDAAAYAWLLETDAAPVAIIAESK